MVVGPLNEHAGDWEGEDRFVARKSFIKALEKEGFLVNKENHINNVGTSERTKAVIEPRLSDQWFLKMETLAEPAIKAVLESEEVALLPKKFKNTYHCTGCGVTFSIIIYNGTNYLRLILKIFVKQGTNWSIN